MEDAERLSWKLLPDALLEQSPIVANSRMNRERSLVGGNGYKRELGFHPLEYLRDVATQSGTASWLDLCCGRGIALIEAARELASKGEPIFLHGIDLVDMFEPVSPALPNLLLEAASLHEWSPPYAYSLITCVHGLHYVGDKLGLVERAVSWLEPDGRFVANIDPANLRSQAGKPLGRILRSRFESGGFDYRRGKHLLVRAGNQPFSFGLKYLGADDRAGPNYTGQEGVDSYYAVVR